MRNKTTTLFLLVIILLFMANGCWKAPPPNQSVAPPTVLNLTFAGDIMAHRPNFTMDDFNRIYAHLAAPLLHDDLTFGNLEAPLDPSRSFYSWPRFNITYPYLNAAIEGGFDVFSLANNHATDWGLSGLRGTRAAFEDASEQHNRPIYSAGLRKSPDGRFHMLSIHHGDWHIGFVSVTQFLNDPRNGEMVQIVEYRSESAQSFIDWIAARRSLYDLIIVAFHAGIEYRTEPSNEKRNYFRLLVDAGADIVWGHHPHVLQPWETVTRPNGNRALILHSTGNFVSAQTWEVGPADAKNERAFTGDSALFKVTVGRKGQGADIVRVSPQLISHYKAPTGGVVVRPLQQLTNAADLSPEWRLFYRQRLQMIRQRFGDIFD